MHRQVLTADRRQTLAREGELLACLRPFVTRHNLVAVMNQAPGLGDEVRWSIALPAPAGAPRSELLIETYSPGDLCIWARAWGRWQGTPTEALMLVHLVALPGGLGRVSACLETARQLATQWDHDWLYRHGRVLRGSIPVARALPPCPFRVGDRVVFTPPGGDTPLPPGYAGYVTQKRSSHDLLVVDDLPFATAPALFSAA